MYAIVNFMTLHVCDLWNLVHITVVGFELIVVIGVLCLLFAFYNGKSWI